MSLRSALGLHWLGNPRIHIDCCASTNDEAARLARAGAAHGTVIIASKQTGGRGREGRPWASPEGGLYLSAVLRPPLPLADVPPMTLAIGIAICDAVRAEGAPAVIKWPNDLLVDGRKLAGVLVESHSQGGKLDAVIAGIGINLDRTPESVANTAISLNSSRRAANRGSAAHPGTAGAIDPSPHSRCGSAAHPGTAGAIDPSPHSLFGSAAHPGTAGAIDPSPHSLFGSAAHPGTAGAIDREAFVTSLLAHVERWIDRYVAGGLPAIIPAWQERMAPGLAARATVDGAALTGVVCGLDDDGAVMLRDDTGRLHRVRSGDVDAVRNESAFA